MDLLTQPKNTGQCSLFCAAMLLGEKPVTVIAELGHNGQEVIEPKLPAPFCYRGICIEELQDIFMRRGLVLVRFDAEPYWHVGKTKVTQYTREEGRARILKIIQARPAMLEGAGHMVAWDGERVLDPIRGYVDIEDCHIMSVYVPVSLA